MFYIRDFFSVGILSFFFNWLFIVALTARSYRDCHWFSVFGMVLYWYIFEIQQSQMRFFFIHGRHLSGRVQCNHRPRPRCEQTWAQATPSIMRDICRSVSNVVTGPLRRYQSWQSPWIDPWILNHETRPHLWATVWVQITMLGNLSHHFDNNGFRSRETVNINIVSIIVEYGDQPDICFWKITNSLAISRLRKPLKTSTSLAGHGIWTWDLPNVSFVHYHGATSLGLSFSLYMQKHFLSLNPWRYSSEEPRPTEVVAARWQYRGLCG